MAVMSNIKKRVGILKDVRSLTLENIFSAICFIAGTIFLIVAISGLWRHFFTMGLCFAVGIMISDEEKPAQKKRRHEDKMSS